MSDPSSNHSSDRQIAIDIVAHALTSGYSGALPTPNLCESVDPQRHLGRAEGLTLALAIMGQVPIGDDQGWEDLRANYAALASREGDLFLVVG